ncbi:MAG: hypothetical protein IJQ63_03890 [Synergistaceae bacterium]|nr:hypothetical protein [Synergistaceae bacterium]MBR0220893.1 hypothetical protein [Synergistaceae bacterium]
MKKVLTSYKVNGRSKLTKKADIIDAILKIAKGETMAVPQSKPTIEVDANTANADELSKLTVKELCDILSKHNVKGCSKLTKKADIIDAVIKSQPTHEPKKAQIIDAPKPIVKAEIKPEPKAEPEVMKAVYVPYEKVQEFVQKQKLIECGEHDRVIPNSRLDAMSLTQLREYSQLPIEEISQTLCYNIDEYKRDEAGNNPNVADSMRRFLTRYIGGA